MVGLALFRNISTNYAVQSVRTKYWEVFQSIISIKNWFQQNGEIQFKARYDGIFCWKFMLENHNAWPALKFSSYRRKSSHDFCVNFQFGIFEGHTFLVIRSTTDGIKCIHERNIAGKWVPSNFLWWNSIYGILIRLDIL